MNLRRRLRRSLQLRVMILTLMLSAVVVTLLGLLISSQVAKGLLDAKTSAALSEAQVGREYALNQLAQPGQGTQQTLDTQLAAVLTYLASSSGQAGLFDVAVLSGSTPGYSTDPRLTAQVPSGLRGRVQHNQVAYTFVRLTTADQHPPVQQMLVVGEPLGISTGIYELYYLFPLTFEKRTLDLVDRRLEQGSVILVLLVVAVAGVVTRLVVRPVRQAAGVASRLASGRLEERMPVRGEDELAALASSFNAMATELQRQIVQLEELSRVQQRFTADVSHELRTPLTTVRMAADVLFADRESFPAGAARSAELLAHELDRFEELLGDLLEISRYDAHVAVLEAEPVDLAELVHSVVRGLAVHSERHGCCIDTSAVPMEPVIVEVDPRRVRRILVNLLTNALDHAERQPVEVALACDGDAAAVRVRDHGVGLREGEAQRVFDRFWRADPSRARQTGGTGLGLSIALEDARLHGGSLRAWGRPGQGASFLLVLPCRDGGAVTSEPLPLAPQDIAAPTTEPSR